MKTQFSKGIIATTGLVGITFCTGMVLTGSFVSADDVVDDISITVPTSCTMSGSGMNTHSAEVANGTYRADIGTTTINVLCNDYAGFSIYATGFSGETIGQTNSNKLVGTSASSNATIDTGTATSAGNPDVSNWAMKLTTDSQSTYPVTIINGFDSYHGVPNGYDKVASSASGTDVGQSATGASLTATYAAYVSRTQPADAYSGKVKYTLVYPNNGAAPSPSAPGVTDLVIVTPPTKTIYNENETIDLTGIIVKAYYQDGTEWGEIPVSDISISSSSAELIGPYNGTATSSQMYGEKIKMTTNLAMRQEPSSDYIYIDLSGGLFSHFISASRYLDHTFIAASSSPGTFDYRWRRWYVGENDTTYATEYSQNYTYNGRTVYYYAMDFYMQQFTSNAFNNRQLVNGNEIKYVAWAMVYGDIEAKIPVTISWQNPETGETISATYEITIRRSNS